MADLSGIRIVRRGRVTFENGVVLDPATGYSCGCVTGRDGEAFVVRPCPAGPACPVVIFVQQETQRLGHANAFATNRNDLEELKRRAHA